MRNNRRPHGPGKEGMAWMKRRVRPWAGLVALLLASCGGSSKPGQDTGTDQDAAGDEAGGDLHETAPDQDGDGADGVELDGQPDDAADTEEGPGGRLQVSGNARFLVTEDASPFFYLADTAWELFRMTTREEADQYLANRASKGYNVVMACSHGVEDAPYNLDWPNRYGHVPFDDNDFKTPRVLDGPDNDYWDHVDYVITRAGEHGLYVAFLPYWARDYATGGSWCACKNTLPDDDCCVDAETAYEIGFFLGRRYGARDNVIWVLGGDNNAEGEEYVIRETARGLAEGATGAESYSELVMTYHVNGWADEPRSSSAYFHDDPWLTFNGIQSGHYMNYPNYDLVSHDYELSPIKPVSDMESVYEGIYDNFDPSNQRFTDVEVRKKAYWAVFAGAFGHTYGNNNVWQFYAPDLEPRYYADRYWHEELDNPSAQQMTHLKRLMESRPFLSRIPDQGILATDEGDSESRIQATRDREGSYAMIYVTDHGRVPDVTIRMSFISGSQASAWWYDPRDGSHTGPEAIINDGLEETFSVPVTSGPDWILVIDDAAAGFGPPGAP